MRSNDLWQQLSSAVMEELVDYVQPLTFGDLRVVVPASQFTGGWHCSAHGGEVYVGDDAHWCLAVYREDALQRRIGEGELSAMGSAVVADAVFVADCSSHSLVVYPRAGGARLRCFGSYGSRPGALRGPGGLAACGGRVYVADGLGVSVFTDDGAFSARVGDEPFLPRGVAADGRSVFVAHANGGVRVFRADSLLVERLVGGAIVQNPWGVCVSDGVLFVADGMARRVVAFDSVSGDFVASREDFEHAFDSPCGVAVRADGTLFITTLGGYREWRLYAAQLL